MFIFLFCFVALRDVSEEELTAPVHCTPQDYIGVERGIQGHQNSCYLDATLFGLFALTNEFDTMFLPKTGDSEATTIGNILWKNIVNPLRKYVQSRFSIIARANWKFKSRLCVVWLKGSRTLTEACCADYRIGVVKYECVTKLRERLDQLGKMKGITQDEKGMFASGVGAQA